jgi:undecaprenyl pyrophosphate synthase
LDKNRVIAQNKNEFIREYRSPRLPKHLAIIMDGNGRAKQQGFTLLVTKAVQNQ